MINKNFLYIINSIVNYYTNADAATPITIKKTGKIVLRKIKNILAEEDFFEEWGVYETDMPTIFSDEEKKIIYQLIEKAKKDYLENDVDLTAILDAENFTDIKIKLFDELDKNNTILPSKMTVTHESLKTTADNKKVAVEKWRAYWDKVDFETHNQDGLKK